MIKENFFTFPISIGSYQKFIDEIFNISEQQESSYVCFANVHMVIEAYNDPRFNSVVRNADIVTPDGKPVALFLRYFKKINQERVAGLDVFPDLLKEAEAKGKSIYFYGTTDDILDKIAEKAKTEYPSLNICGQYSPPFRNLSEDEKLEIVDRINNAKPDLIFIALGCPKQENWMAEHKNKIKGCMLGLGHAFKVYAGLAKRSPKWMQRLSLEWAYRLYQEPGRLWKRYLYTNSFFVLLTIKYFFSSLFSSGKKQKSSQMVYKCEYQIVWTPHQRIEMLTEGIEDTLQRDARRLCEQKGCSVKALNVRHDYIHLSISIPPEIPVAPLLKTLKSKLGAKLLQAYPNLKKNHSSNFWASGHFISTDLLSDNVIRRYVRFREGNVN